MAELVHEERAATVFATLEDLGGHDDEAHVPPSKHVRGAWPTVGVVAHVRKDRRVVLQSSTEWDVAADAIDVRVQLPENLKVARCVHASPRRREPLLGDDDKGADREQRRQRDPGRRRGGC